jgi:hypothetical protein
MCPEQEMPRKKPKHGLMSLILLLVILGGISGLGSPRQILSRPASPARRDVAGMGVESD